MAKQRADIKIKNFTTPEFSDENLKLWDDNSTRIWYNVSEEIRARQQYWTEDLLRRQVCCDMSQGKLLDSQARAALEANGITPVEPNIVCTMINNSVDNIYRAHYIGRIKTLFNQEAAIDSATLDLLIKSLKSDINFDDQLYEMAKIGNSQGFFTFLKADIRDVDVGKGRVELKLYSADAVLPDMKIYRTSADVKDIILIDHINNEDLYINFGDKKEQIDEYMNMYDLDYVSTVTKKQVMVSRAEVQRRFETLKTAPIGSTLTNRDYCVVYTWLRQVVADVKCFIDPESSNEIIITPDWTAEKIEEFIYENPTYQIVERTRFVLWDTTITDRGIVLRNRMYPVQIPTTAKNVSLPGVCYTPEIIHGRPTGLIDIIASDLRTLAICVSEAQHQIFISSGKTIFAERGAVDNPDELREEATNRVGLVIANEGALTSGKITIQPQQANETLNNFYETLIKRINEYAGISQEMQGRMQSSGSNYRTKMSIIQSMSSRSSAIRALTRADLDMTNILLYLFTLTTTDEEVFSIFGNDGEQKDVKVNEVDFVKKDGAWRIVRVMNDLRRGKFKYLITEQSTSALNDDIEQEEFQTFINGSGSVLMNLMANQPEQAVMIFRAMPNSLIKQMGDNLAEQIENDAEQAAQQPQLPGPDGQGAPALPNQNPQEQIQEAEILPGQQAQLPASESGNQSEYLIPEEARNYANNLVNMRGVQ